MLGKSLEQMRLFTVHGEFMTKPIHHFRTEYDSFCSSAWQPSAPALPRQHPPASPIPTLSPAPGQQSFFICSAPWSSEAAAATAATHF